MKRSFPLLTFALTLLALLLAGPARAVDQITATIVVSNNPAGNTFNLTINASTRTYTNNISSSPSTLIQVTNTTANAATGLLNHLTIYPASTGHRLKQSTETNVIIVGSIGEALSVSAAGAWATITLSTNPVTAPVFGVRVPISVERGTNQTNIASLLVLALEKSTNGLSAAAPAGTNYVNRATAQSIGGNKDFTAVISATNSILDHPTLLNPVGSNTVNIGNAIRSPGAGGNSFQAGSNALALGANSIAVGNDALASAVNGLAVGTRAVASNQTATAVGNFAQALTNGATALGTAIASGSSSLALGAAIATAEASIALGTEDTRASALNAVAIGALAQATHTNSVALGVGAATTAADQIRLGAATHTVSIPGNATIAGLVTITGSQSNTTFTGTNTLGGALAIPKFSLTGLANTNNVFDPGTNIVVYVSGPSQLHDIVGITGGWPGRVLRVSNRSTFNQIWRHQSGGTAAANRVNTCVGSDFTITNNPGWVDLSYDGASLRWEVTAHSD